MVSRCRFWATDSSRYRLRTQSVVRAKRSKWATASSTPLNQQDTGFRNFSDPNYLRRILNMFNLK